MSRENVELVMALQLGPEVDLARLFRDDDMWAAGTETLAALYHSDAESVFPNLLGGGKTYIGPDGLRTGWLDWLAPWETYRAEVQEAVDLGDRVLLLIRDYARRRGSEAELRSSNAAVWTVRDGKVARAEFYPNRDEALRAVGLEK
jgi:ketosteroid isomerase-like protein